MGGNKVIPNLFYLISFYIFLALAKTRVSLTGITHPVARRLRHFQFHIRQPHDGWGSTLWNNSNKKRNMPIRQSYKTIWSSWSPLWSQDAFVITLIWMSIPFYCSTMVWAKKTIDGLDGNSTFTLDAKLPLIILYSKNNTAIQEVGYLPFPM